MSSTSSFGAVGPLELGGQFGWVQTDDGTQRRTSRFTSCMPGAMAVILSRTRRDGRRTKTIGAPRGIGMSTTTLRRTRPRSVAMSGVARPHPARDIEDGGASCGLTFRMAVSAAGGTHAGTRGSVCNVQIETSKVQEPFWTPSASQLGSPSSQSRSLAPRLGPIRWLVTRHSARQSAWPRWPPGMRAQAVRSDGGRPQGLEARSTSRRAVRKTVRSL